MMRSCQGIIFSRQTRAKYDCWKSLNFGKLGLGCMFTDTAADRGTKHLALVRSHHVPSNSTNCFSCPTIAMHSQPLSLTRSLNVARKIAGRGTGRSSHSRFSVVRHDVVPLGETPSSSSANWPNSMSIADVHRHGDRCMHSHGHESGACDRHATYHETQSQRCPLTKPHGSIWPRSTTGKSVCAVDRCCSTGMGMPYGQRHFSTGSRLQQGDSDSPKQVRGMVFRMPTPFRYLKNMAFVYFLRKVDPSFDAKEFRVGAKQAAIFLTQLVAKEDYDSIGDLTTDSALEQIRNQVGSWSPEQRSVIEIKDEDINMVTSNVKRIKFNASLSSFTVDVVLGVLAMKARPMPMVINIALVFRREYNSAEGGIDWTISDVEAFSMHSLFP